MRYKKGIFRTFTRVCDRTFSIIGSRTRLYEWERVFVIYFYPIAGAGAQEVTCALTRLALNHRD